MPSKPVTEMSQNKERKARIPGFYRPEVQLPAH